MRIKAFLNYLRTLDAFMLFHNGSRQSQKTKHGLRLVITPYITPTHYLKANSPEYFKLDILTQACHELGHYFVAPKSRRTRKDFGIPQITITNQDRWELEDAKACIVAKHIGQKFGISTSPPAHHKKASEKWWKANKERLVKEIGF